MKSRREAIRLQWQQIVEVIRDALPDATVASGLWSAFARRDGLTWRWLLAGDKTEMELGFWSGSIEFGTVVDSDLTRRSQIGVRIDDASGHPVLVADGQLLSEWLAATIAHIKGDSDDRG